MNCSKWRSIDDSVSEEQGVMVLDAVEQECVEFSKNLMAEFAKRN